MTDWNLVEGFKKQEFAPPGMIESGMKFWDMHEDLITELEWIRGRAIDCYGRARVIIHENGGYAVEGHSPSSLHYLGRAADFHIENFSEKHNCWVLVPWVDQFLFVYPSLEKDSWGLGLHPEWNNKGFHLGYSLGVRASAVWRKSGIEGYKNYVWSDLHVALSDCIATEFMSGN